MKLSIEKKILLASILFGILQGIYNLFKGVSFNNSLITTFEGTFMFIFIAFLFFVYRNGIFKEWVTFSIVLAVGYILLSYIPQGFNFLNIGELFFLKLISSVISIKFADYIIK